MIGFLAVALAANKVTLTPAKTLCSDGKCTGETSIGCEISGITDFAALTDGDIATIRGALNEHGVIYFHGVAKYLTPETQLGFAERFGIVLPEISTVPKYVEKGVHQSAHSVRGNETGSKNAGKAADVSVNTMVEANKLQNKVFEGKQMPHKMARLVREPGDPFAFGEGYHADVSFFESPPVFTLLLARDLPGGEDDTFFLDAGRAYRTMSDEMRAEVEGLSCVHNDSAGMANVHPMIRTHPESGRRIMYANSHFTRKIAGYEEAEGKKVLDKVFDHVESMPVFKFKWTCEKDKCGGKTCPECQHMLMWDNRQLQHTATTTWASNEVLNKRRRELHRVTISDPEQLRPFFRPAGLAKKGRAEL